jgi:ribosomal protein L20A (L18A)
MKYKVCVETINIIEIDANSKEDAINRVRSGLVAQKQIKEADPIRFSVIEEVNLEDVKNEKE